MNTRELQTFLNGPCNLMQHRFTYLTISQRAHGLSIGVNFNPDQKCNFDCLYCHVQRREKYSARKLNVPEMGKELKRLLLLCELERVQELPQFGQIPAELLQLKQVALSGEGEPTLCPIFDQAVQEIVKIRMLPHFPKFKMVLLTNGTGLHLEAVVIGLRLFEPQDEVWIKLDAGTEASMRAVNRNTVPLDMVLTNIVALGRQRPVTIQSLFCSIDGVSLSDSEIETYANQLRELKEEGANIALVQVYSVTEKPAHSGCRHLPLAELSQIARHIKSITGLKVEVF